jgi:RimJ/RimL family protein N-acetyltransferase
MSSVERKTIVDKIGQELELRSCSTVDHWALADMYDCFVPKAITQGLPPINAEARFCWVKNLLMNGENFAVWDAGRVVGHSSMIADISAGDAEYLIFVDGRYRNRGLGTELTCIAVDRAREMGLKSIWLTVEALNFKAIKLYKKMGFEFSDSGERERTMILEL